MNFLLHIREPWSIASKDTDCVDVRGSYDYRVILGKVVENTDDWNKHYP